MSSAKTPKSKRAAPKGAARGVSLTDALGDASWLDADRALAQALAELAEVDGAASAVKRAEALMLLRQSLARAARVRGFTRVGGEAGEIERYDPARHELITAAKRAPEEVVIITQGVARGANILVKARAKAVRRRPPP